MDRFLPSEDQPWPSSRVGTTRKGGPLRPPACRRCTGRGYQQAVQWARLQPPPPARPSEEKGGDRKEPLLLREVAGAGGGDPPGSAAAPLLSFLQRPPEQVPWRGRGTATAAAPSRAARGAWPRVKGEQNLGHVVGAKRGGGWMEEERTRGTIGSGTRIWSERWEGVGGRRWRRRRSPHVGRGCAFTYALAKGGGEGSWGLRVRARSAAVHVTGTPRIGFHVTGREADRGWVMLCRGSITVVIGGFRLVCLFSSLLGGIGWEI